ncbi:hypothetical protein M8818_003677 [Zalaria obscura]|uniref:Uncharacterized protein n=1 Tax=Zalaria obscura TaxID=2024903 RepID=A0ACC3SEM2_9PEZI
MSSPRFLLHTFYRSSCSARLRIALNLKSIPYDCEYVALDKYEQHTPTHRKLNPSGSVPVLTILMPDLIGVNFSIPQSVAALEYLEETYTDYPLLPTGYRPWERAQVRTLVNIIACDVQPVTNRRTNKAVEALNGSLQDWCNHFTACGLEAYEEMVSKTAGKFSVGDQITLADVCLIPAVWNAEMYEVDLEMFPRVIDIYARLSELDAVKKAHWRVQPDTPKDGALV